MVKNFVFYWGSGVGGRGSVDLGNKGQMKIMQMPDASQGRRSQVAGRRSNVARFFRSRDGGEPRTKNQGPMAKKGQMKIMQMSFMIVGVFIFFVLVGLFFLAISLKDVRSSAEELQRAQTISSLGVIIGMNELAYATGDSMSVDEDKLRIMSSGMGEVYGELWPVASLEFYKVYPEFDSVVECPGLGCNYYSVYNSGQRNIEKYSSFVSVCKRVKEVNSIFDRCEIWKAVVGVKIRESEVGSR
ncbi:MAG TPA: hypothetical protein ENH20_01245 [Candidatus Pacearchaeota archaeon]|nr:hypothetical protein [Candidatus Pacearchaeota archaeon]